MTWKDAYKGMWIIRQDELKPIDRIAQTVGDIDGYRGKLRCCRLSLGVSWCLRFWGCNWGRLNGNNPATIGGLLLTVIVEGQTGERMTWLFEGHLGRDRYREFAFVALLKGRVDFAFQLWMAMAILRLSLSPHGDVREWIMMCEVCRMTGDFNFMDG